MITKSTAIEVLNEALATGADFAEIYLEEDDQTTIRMDNGNVWNVSPFDKDWPEAPSAGRKETNEWNTVSAEYRISAKEEQNGITSV